MAVSSDLWKILNAIRGRIDVSDFRQYVMPFMFYWAANQKIELLMKEELENDGITYNEAWNFKDTHRQMNMYTEKN